VHTRAGWTSPILSYLKDGRLPSKPDEAKQIKKRAAQFTVLNEEFLTKEASYNLT